MPKRDREQRVVLDTHTILWWHAESDRLSDVALRAIAGAPVVLVSPISFWEIAMLVQKGRVALDRPTAVWVSDFQSTDRVEIADLTPAIAVRAAELSDIHGDPADRILVATAGALGLPLVTKDDKIHAHAKLAASVTALR
jgi:PIN domain nuclease of toxin-antitoxin system